MKSLSLKSLTRNTAKKGFTLLELSISIVMIILLGLGIFVLVRSVQASTRAQTEQGNINAIAACLNSTYQGDYGGLNNQRAKDADCLPYTMKPTAAGAITSAWGSSVTLAGAAASATNGSVFTITYPSMSSEVCKKLVPGLTKVYERVVVGSNAALNLQSSAAAVITACNAAADQTLVVTGR